MKINLAESSVAVDDEFAEVVAIIIECNVAQSKLKMINDHFSHMRATFWLGIEWCSNLRRNLVLDESDPRFA